MPDQPTAQDILVDGEVIDLDDFTFRENREIQRLIREEILEDPDALVDFDALSLNDFLPAAITVFKRRSNPDYSLESAMDLKIKDVLKASNGRPPTKPKRSATRAHA